MGERGGGAKPTIYDVAERAGVSKSLVSLVLNGSPLVSDDKRAAVQIAIRELGYRPSRAAANLAANRTRTIGLVIDDFQNPWFVDLLRGLRLSLHNRGYHVAIREHFELGGKFFNAVTGFLDTQVDGLVIAAEPGADLPRIGVPTVVEGTRLHRVPGADEVKSDQETGVRLILDHLHSQGHIRIGHVTGAGGSARYRNAVYEQWMGERGVEPRVAGEGNPTNEEGGYLGGVALLAAHPDVTAILAANDTMALGVRAASREAGRSVPSDVALAGYDNSQLARSRFLDLTTIDPQGIEVGMACGAALLRRLEDPGAPRSRAVVQPSLIVRSSTDNSRW